MTHTEAIAAIERLIQNAVEINVASHGKALTEVNWFIERLQRMSYEARAALEVLRAGEKASESSVSSSSCNESGHEWRWKSDIQQDECRKCGKLE